jgi:PAP2 superfamily
MRSTPQTPRKRFLPNILAGLMLLAAPPFAWPQTVPTPAESEAREASIAAPAVAQFSGQLVLDWMQLTLLLAQQTPGMSPPVTARAFAYQSLALYESVVSGMAGHQSLAGQLNELSSLPLAQPDEALHWPTVANASLAAITRMMFPHASAEHKGRISQLERSLPLKYSRDFDPTRTTIERNRRSETFGRLMAMAVMTWARTDGGHEAWGPVRRDQANYVPPSNPGQWVLTPPGFIAPLLPYWGSNRPFVLPQGNPSSVCPAPEPIAYSEDANSAFQRQVQEVHRISTQATQEQRQIALYWADDPLKTPTPAGHWLHIATDVLREKQANLADTASALVRLNLAMSDAFVAAWHAKYHFQVLRPVTAVQLSIDSRWVPPLMHTPPFPEYPSGHSVQSAAAAQVLDAIFGANTAFTDNAHNDRGWGPRNFRSFQTAAQEAAMSRLYAGIHYRFGIEGGLVQGRCVGQKILGLKLKP